MIARKLQLIYLYVTFAVSAACLSGCGSSGGGYNDVSEIPTFNSSNESNSDNNVGENSPALSSGVSSPQPVDGGGTQDPAPATGSNAAETGGSENTDTNTDTTTPQEQGTITDTETATEPAAARYALSGAVFVDSNADASKAEDEPGIPGMTVTVKDSQNNAVANTTTDDAGRFQASLAPGTYVLKAAGSSGYSPTDGVSLTVTLQNADASGNDLAFTLDLASLATMTANTRGGGGFWKANIAKAVRGQTSGAQVDADTLQGYVDIISNLFLSPLNITTLEQAETILSTNGSDPLDKLARSLLTAEFNYAAQGAIGDNASLTQTFLQYAEYVYLHSDQYSDSDIMTVRNWVESFNNAGGGPIGVPVL